MPASNTTECPRRTFLVPVIATPHSVGADASQSAAIADYAVNTARPAVLTPLTVVPYRETPDRSQDGRASLCIVGARIASGRGQPLGGDEKKPTLEALLSFATTGRRRRVGLTVGLQARPHIEPEARWRRVRPERSDRVVSARAVPTLTGSSEAHRGRARASPNSTRRRPGTASSPATPTERRSPTSIARIEPEDATTGKLRARDEARRNIANCRRC